MRVDSSLLDGITAANTAAKTLSAAMKSSGTTTSFSSALKSASDAETTKPVTGQPYSEILTGPRAGMYLNTSGNDHDGEAFVLVKHDGREDHIYGTGKDRKVVGVGGEPAAAKPASGEKTTPVSGRAYSDITSGERSDMFINTSGNVRNGDAFLLVKRSSREYHIYGTGKDRVVVSLKPPTDAAKTTDPATPPVSTAPTKTDATPADTGSSAVDGTT